MKKTLFLLLLAIFTSFHSLAYSFALLNDEGITIYYNTNSDNSSVTVTYGETEYNSYTSRINIPESIYRNGKSYQVTKIGDKAFYDCPDVTEVIMPNSITSIGDYAFYLCQSLKELKIPSSVISIGEKAFSCCFYLQEMIIPNSVINIGTDAFYNCLNLIKSCYPSHIENPFNLTSLSIEYPSGSIIDQENGIIYNQNRTTIYYVSYLTDQYTIPESIINIGDYAFYECNLKEIKIPDSVITIGKEAFLGCGHLSTVIIPPYIESIGIDAFILCNNLYKIIMLTNSVPDGIEEAFSTLDGRQTYVNNHNFDSYTSVLGSLNIYPNLDSLFTLDGITYIVDTINHSIDVIDCDYSYNLESISIPSTITYNEIDIPVNNIKNYAFNFYDSIISLQIGENVNYIGDMAFSKCIGLQDVTFQNGESPINIGTNPFYKCPILNLNSQRDFNYVSGESPFKDCTTLENLYIAGNSTVIKSDEFEGCSSLKTISTEGHLNNIESSAFIGNSSIISVSIDGIYVNIGNDAFNGCTEIESLILKENVSLIGNRAFKNCNKVSNNLRLGHNVDVIIQDEAFLNCKSVTSFSLGNNLISIGMNAFKGCVLIPRFNLGSRLTSVGKGAFENCKSITSIILPTSLVEVSASLFAGCENLSSVFLPSTVTSIGDYAFYNTPALISLGFPESLTSLGAHAFDGCAITEAQIPNGVTELLEGVFANSGLQSFVIRSTVRTIGDGAFDNCSSLTSLNIEPATTDLTLGKNAASQGLFKTCGLQSVTIGRPLIFDKTEAGGYSPFYGNSSLKNVILSDYAREISSRMFSQCENLETVTLGNDVCSLGTYAFAGSGIQSVNFPDKINTIPSYCFSNCQRIVTLNLPETIHYIENYAFAGSSLQTLVLPAAVENIADHTFYNTTQLSSLTIQQGTKTIGDYAFVGSSLPALTIPSSITSVGTASFDGVTGLASLTINDGTIPLAIANSEDNKGLFSNVPLQELYIGRELSYNSTKSYGYSPFYNNISLQSVTIGDIPTKIYAYEFKDCSALEEVTVGNGVSEISHFSFSGCAKLNSFIMGISITTLGDEVFSGCTKLTHLQVSALNPPNCGELTLSDIDKYNCTLFVPNGSESNYSATYQWEDFFLVEGFDAGVLVSYIELSQNTASLGVDATLQLSATCYPEAALVRNVIWSTSNSDVATVSTTGLVTAKRSGYADITATAADGSGVKAICRLTVTNEDETYSYRFEISNMDIYPEVVTNFPVALVNDNSVLAFQCDLVLPAGVTLATDEYDDYYIEYSDRAPRHLATFGETDGVIHIAGYNMNNTLITGNSGTLFYLPLIATGDPRDCTISIRNIHLSKEGNSDEELTPVSATLSVQPDFIPGDANGDGVVSVTDFTMTICYIVNQPLSNFIFEAADVDGDGKILIADATSILGKALSGVSKAPQKSCVSLGESKPYEYGNIRLSDIMMDEDGAGHAFISLENASNYIACQFDIMLPEGISIEDITLSNNNGLRHDILFKTVEEMGVTRVIVASFSNSHLFDDRIAEVTFRCEDLNSLNGAQAAIINAIGVIQDEEGTPEIALEGNVAEIMGNISGMGTILTRDGLRIAVVGRTLIVTASRDSILRISDIAGRYRIYNITEGVSRIEIPASGLYIVNDTKLFIE